MTNSVHNNLGPQGWLLGERPYNHTSPGGSGMAGAETPLDLQRLLQERPEEALRLARRLIREEGQGKELSFRYLQQMFGATFESWHDAQAGLNQENRLELTNSHMSLLGEVLHRLENHAVYGREARSLLAEYERLSGFNELESTFRSGTGFWGRSTFEKYGVFVNLGSSVAGALGGLASVYFGMTGNLGMSVASGVANALFQSGLQLTHQYAEGSDLETVQVVGELGEAAAAAVACSFIAYGAGRAEGMGLVTKDSKLWIRGTWMLTKFCLDVGGEYVCNGVSPVKRLLGLEPQGFVKTWKGLAYGLAANALGEILGDATSHLAHPVTHRIELRTQDLLNRAIENDPALRAFLQEQTASNDNNEVPEIIQTAQREGPANDTVWAEPLKQVVGENYDTSQSTDSNSNPNPRGVLHLVREQVQDHAFQASGEKDRRSLSSVGFGKTDEVIINRTGLGETSTQRASKINTSQVNDDDDLEILESRTRVLLEENLSAKFEKNLLSITRDFELIRAAQKVNSGEYKAARRRLQFIRSHLELRDVYGDIRQGPFSFFQYQVLKYYRMETRQGIPIHFSGSNETYFYPCGLENQASPETVFYTPEAQVLMNELQKYLEGVKVNGSAEELLSHRAPMDLVQRVSNYHLLDLLRKTGALLFVEDAFVLIKPLGENRNVVDPSYLTSALQSLQNKSASPEAYRVFEILFPGEDLFFGEPDTPYATGVARLVARSENEALFSVLRIADLKRKNTRVRIASVELYEELAAAYWGEQALRIIPVGQVFDSVTLARWHAMGLHPLSIFADNVALADLCGALVHPWIFGRLHEVHHLLQAARYSKLVHEYIHETLIWGEENFKQHEVVLFHLRRLVDTDNSLDLAGIRGLFASTLLFDHSDKKSVRETYHQLYGYYLQLKGKTVPTSHAALHTELCLNVWARLKEISEVLSVEFNLPKPIEDKDFKVGNNEKVESIAMCHPSYLEEQSFSAAYSFLLMPPLLDAVSFSHHSAEVAFTPLLSLSLFFGIKHFLSSSPIGTVTRRVSALASAAAVFFATSSLFARVPHEHISTSSTNLWTLLATLLSGALMVAIVPPKLATTKASVRFSPKQEPLKIELDLNTKHFESFLAEASSPRLQVGKVIPVGTTERGETISLVFESRSALDAEEIALYPETKVKLNFLIVEGSPKAPLSKGKLEIHVGEKELSVFQITTRQKVKNGRAPFFYMRPGIGSMLLTWLATLAALKGVKLNLLSVNSLPLIRSLISNKLFLATEKFDSVVQAVNEDGKVVWEKSLANLSERDYRAMEAGALCTDYDGIDIRLYPWSELLTPTPESETSKSKVPKIRKERETEKLPLVGTPKIEAHLTESTNTEDKYFEWLQNLEARVNQKKLFEGFSLKDVELLAYRSFSHETEDRENILEFLSLCLSKLNECRPPSVLERVHARFRLLVGIALIHLRKEIRLRQTR